MPGILAPDLSPDPTCAHLPVLLFQIFLNDDTFAIFLIMLTQKWA
jgi:hypothetical protein